MLCPMLLNHLFTSYQLQWQILTKSWAGKFWKDNYIVWLPKCLSLPPTDQLSPSYIFCFSVCPCVRHRYPCPSFWNTPYNDFVSAIWWFWPYLTEIKHFIYKKMTSIRCFYHPHPSLKGSSTFPSVSAHGMTDTEIRTRTGVADRHLT